MRRIEIGACLLLSAASLVLALHWLWLFLR